MKLEKADSDDIEKFLALSKKQILHYFIENSLEWSDKDRRTYLENADLYRIVDSTFIGYLLIYNKDVEMFIYDLQITQSKQSQGLGTEVIKLVIKIASGKGFKSIRLGSFRSNPACKLYERLGFKIIKQNEYFNWYRYTIT